MTNELLLRTYPDLVFAWHTHTLLVTDRAGEISGAGLQGLYEHDVRLLSRYRLLVHGSPPRLDALSPVDAYSTLAYYVAAPTAEGGGGEEGDRQVLIRVARFVGNGLHEDVEVVNHGLETAHLDLIWEVAADFADYMEQRLGGERKQEAPVTTSWQLTGDGEGELRFDYQHPRLNRGTLLRFPSAKLPPIHENDRVMYQLELSPQERLRLCVRIAPIVDGVVQQPVHSCGAFGTVGTELDRARRTWAAEATRLETNTAAVQYAWDRAVADLASLALGDGLTPPELLAPAAGVPHYVTLFGRDALTACGQSLMLSPQLAEGALRLLARHLGSKDDDFYDEQPGRVPQQVRDDPLALLGLTTFLHDYGDYAAPCAYLVLLGGYHVVTGNTDTTREFLEPAKRVLEWLDERADLDGDGFLEYKTRSPEGQRHQGWKDSRNGVVYEDGRQVEPPIAACEIQGYWYAAKLLMAEVFLALGESARALDQFRTAGELKKRFNQHFWMEDERFIAFGLDADKRQIRSIASNAGHCLATGIVSKERAADVVRGLMAPAMFSGWGIRTLSSDNPAYNPFKYHLGSVWPAENATTAFGMKRYGFAAECNAVAKALFDAAALFEHHRLPEVFGGLPRDAEHPHPGLYPDACAPQAWSASAIVWLIQAMLGLWTYAPLDAVIVEPALPDWLPELIVRDLRVGSGKVSIQFHRGADGLTDYRVLEKEGRVRVVRQPAPEAVDVGPVRRLRELVESLLPGH